MVYVEEQQGIGLECMSGMSRTRPALVAGVAGAGAAEEERTAEAAVASSFGGGFGADCEMEVVDMTVAAGLGIELGVAGLKSRRALVVPVRTELAFYQGQKGGSEGRRRVAEKIEVESVGRVGVDTFAVKGAGWAGAVAVESSTDMGMSGLPASGLNRNMTVVAVALVLVVVGERKIPLAHC